MKSKIKMPLVIFTFIMVLGIASAGFYYFNTRETNQFKNNSSISEKNKEDIIETENEEINDQHQEPKKESVIGNTETSNNQNNVSDSKVETPTKKPDNNTSSKENNSKEEVSTKPVEKPKENVDSPKKEENDNTNIYEVPDEDQKNENVPIQDEEYLRIKSTCEFETRPACQAAFDKVAEKYLLEGKGSVSLSCEGVAYKGQIVGYRMKILFEDRTWIYNN